MNRAGIGALLASVTGTLFAFVRSLAPNVLYEQPQRFKAGDPREFADGATFLEDQRVFIFREGKSFHAISAVCAHLGCTVKMVSSEFHCPCHGSKYRSNGVNYAGPAPRPLAFYHLEVSPEDGQLVVDLGQEVDRSFRMNI